MAVYVDMTFEWPVCAAAGYEFHEMSGSRRPAVIHTVLGDKQVSGTAIRPKGTRFHIIRPFMFADLYLQFAELDVGDAEACLAFAKQYGLLTVRDGFEDFVLWRTYSRAMRQRLEDWKTGRNALMSDIRRGTRVGELTAVLRPEPPDGRLQLRLHPNSLWGVMELQQAAAVSEGQELRLCERCSKPFAIGPGAKHAHARHCSTKCQNDANNTKKRRMS